MFWVFKQFPLSASVGLFLLLICGLINSLLARRKDRRRGWRAGRIGRDEIYYEELRGGSWQKIIIHGEMLTTKKPKHRIYFTSAGEWQKHPDWARDRRDEIFSRVKSTLQVPDYEYYESD